MLSNRKIKHPKLTQELRDSVASEAALYSITVASATQRIVQPMVDVVDSDAYVERSLLGG